MFSFLKWQSPPVEDCVDLKQNYKALAVCIIVIFISPFCLYTVLQAPRELKK